MEGICPHATASEPAGGRPACRHINLWKLTLPSCVRGPASDQEMERRKTASSTAGSTMLRASVSWDESITQSCWIKPMLVHGCTVRGGSDIVIESLSSMPSITKSTHFSRYSAKGSDGGERGGGRGRGWCYGNRYYLDGE